MGGRGRGGAHISDAYACQSLPELTPPYPAPPPAQHTANGQQMLALIILILEVSGTLTCCSPVKDLTCLTQVQWGRE